MKISRFLLSICACSLILSGCSKGPKDYENGTIFVTFKDYDQSVLYHTKVEKGSMVKYKGPTPQRDAPIGRVYTFTGWDKNLNETLYENTVFYAQYVLENKKFNVSFVNYDDTLLFKTTVEYDNFAFYQGSTPKKPSNDEHVEYTFKGWDKNVNLYKIQEDTTFKAEYQTQYYVFATFNNFDGTLLKRIKISKGSNVAYDGPKPTRSYSGEDKGYRFTGWDGSLTNLNEDKTFTAQFELVNKYTVTFKNYNGNVLQEVKVLQGDDAVYTGSTPYKPSSQSGDVITSYTFSGWSPSVTNIRSNLTTTAQFTTKTSYTGQTAIKRYLDANGSGSYHNVYTGESTLLGYSGNYFMPGFSYSNGTMVCALAATFTYGSTSGSATIQIRDNSVTTFQANLSLKTSSHRFSEYTITSTSINKYTTTEDKAALISIIYQATSLTLNNGSSFLSSHGLDYIW